LNIGYFARAAAYAVLALLLSCGFPLALHAQSPLPAADATLDVPYLSQTEALCGGAATAMLFRYWGDLHAGVQQFAPLVDRDAGGIADSALIAAIRERGWNAVRIDGSVAALQAELRAGRPPMLLIEDRPQRYHYVVAVTVDERGVLVHDPTWGPARRFSFDELKKAWKPTGFWTLRVTPTPDRRSSAPARASTPTPHADETTGRADPCDARLNAALDQIQSVGLESAAAILQPLIAACPSSSGPLRELAGVRFAEKNWSQASALAKAALERDPQDRYAADVLGSSRFMLNDFDGALRAWNLLGRPTLDSIHITGLTRTRYALVAQALDLPADSVLTDHRFRLARRRLEAMPDLANTRIALRPEADGYAVADVAVVERAALPRNLIQWTAAAVQAALERNVGLNLPGRTGQGETWSGSWGWWENRPRVSMEFAAPMLSKPHGVWRVGLSWEAQTYGPQAASVREERLSGSIGLSSWVTPNLRASLAGGIDGWRRASGDTSRALQVTAGLEQRLFDDRVAVDMSVAHWAGIGGSDGFTFASLDATARNRRDPGPLVAIVRAGVSATSADAPLALWSGAGEGRSRAPLLRAHTLLHDGRIDGPVFGRRLAHATVEAQHWLPRPTLVRLGGALFADTAAANGRPAFAGGRGLQFDTGVGLRVRVPGRSGVFRVDYARGLRDGTRAWVVGWQLNE
jgi:predicted double-glycine peptidase